jgi:hypothetical protein
MSDDHDQMNYDNSPAPKGRFVSSIDPDHAITTDARGNLGYASAGAEGMVEIYVPVPHGPRSEQRMHAKDFPETVIRYVEESLRPNPYPVSSPMKTPTETFRYFVGAAQGLSLLDEGALGNMKTLAQDFESESDRPGYFSEVIRPWLLSLTPGKR